MSSKKLDKNRFAKYALSAPSAASFSYYISLQGSVQEYFMVDIYGAKIYYTNQINFEKVEGWVTKI